MENQIEYIGFIYMWTNSTNGMKYVGSHKGKINDGYIGSGKAFLLAVDKYGIEKFTREILEYVYDVNLILLREQVYLDKFNCAESREYYNISPSSSGGNTGSGQLISIRAKEDFASGKRVSWCKGKKMTADQVKNYKIDLWEVTIPSGEVIIVNNMLKFCKEHNLNPSTMSAVARGKRGKHHGYKCKKLTNKRDVEYEYKEYEYMTQEEKNINTAIKVKESKRLNALPKLIYEGVVYNTIKEAMEITGKSRYILIKNGTVLRAG